MNSDSDGGRQGEQRKGGSYTQKKACTSNTACSFTLTSLDKDGGPRGICASRPRGILLESQLRGISTNPVSCPFEGSRADLESHDKRRQGLFHSGSPLLSPSPAPPSEGLCTGRCLLYYMRVGGGTGAGTCSSVKTWTNALPEAKGIRG